MLALEMLCPATVGTHKPVVYDPYRCGTSVLPGGDESVELRGTLRSTRGRKSSIYFNVC